ncbi:hypothetical protein [Helicobacter marmotae]|uniref:Uncharacterized protein n=1 Tax=Helicobacter marmotae TaxID=152490 RepID=A0A3D8I3U3_9HELI|nr:hypothetical protein [Helicobacter marmotae]RDU59812.1 hypothetical protein CQA63_05185 [Helicobacter marmotae]
MRCGFCERIKKLRKIDVALMVGICVFMYIANQLQLREYRAQKVQESAKIQQKEEAELKIYEDLQRKCYFKQDKNACDELKAY